MKRLTILAVVLVLMLCGCNSQSDNTASSTSSDIAEESEECSFSAGKSDSTAPQISTAPAEQEEASEPPVTSEPLQQAVPSEPAEKPAESTENASEPAEKPAEPPSTEGSGQTESVPETSRQPEASTPAVLANYFKLQFRLESMERQQIYFRGHTDCFAHLKKIGAL
mgnify:CR=1 FL=1